MQHVVGVGMEGPGSGGADAHRERDLLGPRRRGHRPIRLLTRPLGGADREDTGFNGGAQLLERGLDLRWRPAGEEQRELLATVAERPSAVGNLGQLVGHHPQGLVAGGVAEAIVESLETIDVGHGDDVVAVEPLHGLIESAPAGEAGELIVVGEPVGILDHPGE